MSVNNYMAVVLEAVGSWWKVVRLDVNDVDAQVLLTLKVCK